MALDFHPDSFSQQIGYVAFELCHLILIMQCSETFISHKKFLKSGKIRVDFLMMTEIRVTSTFPGDIVVGLEVMVLKCLKKVKFEVKQGPYAIVDKTLRPCSIIW